METDPKAKIQRAKVQRAKSAAALKSIGAALARGENVSLDDAKVLEAAGCWFRRNMVSR